MAEPEKRTLEGTVERVTYADAETGWSVIRFAVNPAESVTAVGNLLGVRVGECLRVHGVWERHRKFGRQFRVESYVGTEPATLTGMERYLSSGLVRGIGKVMASRLVERFGLDTLEVIENASERLAEVEGIGPVRRDEIRKAWTEQRAVKDVMLFLQSHAVSPAYAARIYRRYGAGAITAVKDNPYRLAADIHGIGFRSADAIATSLGIEKDSPIRADAGLLYTLRTATQAGHVFGRRRELIAQAARLLEISAAALEPSVDRLRERGLLVREAGAGDDFLYLPHLHAAESGAARRLRALLDHAAASIPIHLGRARQWIEGQLGVRLASRQWEAVEAGLGKKLLVVTGGPGTGKTTIVTCLVRLLSKKGVRVLLAAPTGRAARRLGEGTGDTAQTLHRLLEFSPRKSRFQRDRQNPLEVDVLVVDEASMVDISLFHALLEAIPSPARLILVGDADQLPSVGPGNVFRDLIASRFVPVITLTDIFRQARRSQIVINAHRVNVGELPQGARTAEPGADFFFIEQAQPEEVLATIRELVTRRIPERFRLDPVEEIQVLTPMQKSLLGVVHLNAQLQMWLNPEGESIVRGARLLRVRDRVMQVRNNYDLGVFNGDIGCIRALDPGAETIQVAFEEREVLYRSDDIDDLVLAYAISIHKSQGSEYPAVVIPLHTMHYVMLQRNLLYTAITRGRKLVVLVGTHRAAALAVGNDRVEERNTYLRERFAWSRGANPCEDRRGDLSSGFERGS